MRAAMGERKRYGMPAATGPYGAGATGHDPALKYLAAERVVAGQGERVSGNQEDDGRGIIGAAGRRKCPSFAI